MTNTSATTPQQPNWLLRALKAIFVEHRMPTFLEKRVDAVMTRLGMPTKIAKVGKFRVRIHRQNADLGFARNIIEKGEYQVEGFDVEPNDIVIDIGANIGSFALYASQKAENGKVYALEPFPDNFELLKENLRINQIKNVVPLQLAVSNQTGSLDFYVASQSGSHSLNNEFQENKDVKIVEKVSVECTTIPKIMSEHSLERCDYLKLDCEGAEYEIINSLPEEYFSRIKKIALEYHLTTTEEREDRVKELGNRLKNYQFELLDHTTAGPFAGLMYFKKIK